VEIISVHSRQECAPLRLLLCGCWCTFDLFWRGTSIGPFNPSVGSNLAPDNTSGRRRLTDPCVFILSRLCLQLTWAAVVGSQKRDCTRGTTEGSTRGRLVAPFHLTFRLWLPPPAPYLTHCLPSGPLLMRVTKFPMSALCVN
jgi:hypothetical protein